MKITNALLQKIIKEEIEQIVQEIEESDLDEGVLDRAIGRAKGGWEQAKAGVKGGAQAAAGAALSKIGAKKAGAELASAATKTKSKAAVMARSKKLEAAIKPKFDEMVNDLTQLGFKVDKEVAMRLMLLMRDKAVQ